MEPLGNVSLRIAHPEDVDTALALLKESASRINHVTDDPSRVLEQISSPLSVFYLIEDKGISIGLAICSAEEDGSTAHIDEFTILKSHRRLGIGGHVLRTLLTDLKLSGFKSVRLETHPLNEATKLYERLEFKFVRELKNFRGTGEPRIILQRGL